jgi:hypothetical protein
MAFLISEVVEAITTIQNDPSLECMTFVVPVTVEALEQSGLSKATIEDRVLQALIAELNACLLPEPNEVQE